MALIHSYSHALLISLASFTLFIIHQAGSVTISAATLMLFCFMETAHVTRVAISANMLMATVKVTVNMSGLFCFEITGAPLTLSVPPC